MKTLCTINVLLSVFLCACPSENAQTNDVYKSKEDIIDCIKTNIEDFDAIKNLIIENPDKFGKHLTIRYSRTKDGVEFYYFRNTDTWTSTLTVEQLFEGQMIRSFMESYECNDLSYACYDSVSTFLFLKNASKKF